MTHKPYGRKPRNDQATAHFNTCPDGHRLPHATDRGNCTPVFCALAEEGSPGKLLHKAGERKTAKTKRLSTAAIEAAKPDADVKSLVKGDEKDLAVQTAQECAAEAKAEALIKMGHAAGRFAARSSFVGLPSGLDGALAEEWADKRLVNLLPAAVAELEFQLKLGDDKQRLEAASKVMDANGRGKRDGGSGATGPIIILTGGSVVTPPWRQAAKVIEAKVEKKDAT